MTDRLTGAEAIKAFCEATGLDLSGSQHTLNIETPAGTLTVEARNTATPDDITHAELDITWTPR